MPKTAAIPLSILAIIAISLAITIVFLVRKAIQREKEINENGIEVDSVVVRDETYTRDGRTRHRTFVKFIGNDGHEHQCQLNVACGMPIGRKVRIKYLLGEYDYVIFVSQEL